MKRVFFLFCFFFISGLSFSQSIEGKWFTYDDKTGKQTSIVEIFKKKNGKFYGKIVFITDEADRNNLCTECPNGEGYSKKDPVTGLEIMRNFSSIDENKWEGKILDPDDGKIYSCQISLTEKGKKLKVRGYIGIPLLGRSQVWVRTN